MKSIKDIDLSPKPGKKYWVNCHREWREEFIYFLLVDRFHDNNIRHSIEFDTRHSGFGDSEQLTKRCGGTIRGIFNHLDYIRNLGCTAIWLSPVFKNNPEELYQIGFTGDSTNWNQNSSCRLGLISVYQGKQFQYENELSNKEIERIEKRFETEILSKIKYSYFKSN